MVVSPIEDKLNFLREAVKAITAHGSFLLSTGRISKYWVPIGDLRTREVVDAFTDVLRHGLSNLDDQTNRATVFYPKYTTTSEDDFPLDFVEWMFSTLVGATRQICSVGYDQHSGTVDIPESAPTGTWIGVFSISVHTDAIVKIVDELIRRKRPVKSILVLVEREQATRQALLLRGVHLIPLVVCDVRTGEPKHLLEIADKPYLDYHEYFA